MKENSQKIKLLKLIELLQYETDELHPLSTNEICNRLSAMGISCERRTLAKDILEGGAWWATVHGVAKSRTRLKRLSSSSSSKGLYILTQG